MSEPYGIGIDVGGTRLKGGAVTAGGELLAAGVATVRPEWLIEETVGAIEAEVRRVAAEVGGRPAGVGLALSGAVDPDRGVVLLPGKFKGLEGYPLVPELRRRTGWPVVADNDGRLSVVAETRYGVARGRRWVVTVTIGTGVGSGVMLDGVILRDPHLQFGTQLGHLVLQAQDGRLCLTGARGTAETLCSATALALAVRDGLQRGIPSVLTDRYWADPHSVDFAAVAAAAREGDRLCVDEVRRWREKLGWLLVTAVHAYAPEVIVLSGGALAAADLFLEAVRAQVREHAFRHPVGEPVPIEVSTVATHAGVLGAAALGLEAGAAHGGIS